jgi:hypothetical protein
MENLGSMEPEQLLQLFSGSLACAFVIFLFALGYVLMSRRGSKTRRRAGWGTSGATQGSSEYSVPAPQEMQSSRTPTPSGSLAGMGSSGSEPFPIDVSARLAGTGREAWLEEVSPRPSDAPVIEEHAPYHVQEVLRLVRDPLTGQFWTQAAGMRYRRLNDIRDRAVGERVLAAITHLLRFSDGMVATDQGVVTLELPPCDAVEMPTAFGVLSDAREPGDVIRVMSNPRMNHFCVHVVDRCYRRLVEVTDRATGQYILEAITRLLQFSNGMLATNDGFGVVAVPPLGADAHTPLPASPAPSSQVSRSVAASPASHMLDSVARSEVSSPVASSAPLSEEERFLQQLMSQIPPQPETPVEPPSLVGSIRRMRKKASAEPLPLLDLAGEIDRIFQSKLFASGVAAIDAKVESNPDGGVRIRVGTAYYNSPDEVPDPRLRDLLKLSIAEWEQG